MWRLQLQIRFARPVVDTLTATLFFFCDIELQMEFAADMLCISWIGLWELSRSLEHSITVRHTSNNIKNKISSWIANYPGTEITDTNTVVGYFNLFPSSVTATQGEIINLKSKERSPVAVISFTGYRKLAIQHIIYSSCSSQPTNWWMASHTQAATLLIFSSFNPRLLIQDNVTFFKGFAVIFRWYIQPMKLINEFGQCWWVKFISRVLTYLSGHVYYLGLFIKCVLSFLVQFQAFK